MKTFKNKKGFTLIELLAVIVVLAIVSVLATRSILPYITNTGRDAFASEANIAISSTTDAMSLITAGLIDSSNYTKNAAGTKYCFTLDNLKAISLWTKEDTNYAGRVVVTVPSSGYAYTYTITMHNKDYIVNAVSGTVKNENAVKYVASEHTNTKFDCSDIS